MDIFKMEKMIKEIEKELEEYKPEIRKKYENAKKYCPEKLKSIQLQIIRMFAIRILPKWKPKSKINKK